MQLMIQQEKPQLACTMPVVWPTLLDLGRDECKRILRKLELEAYAGVISALRAQGDLTKDKKDLLGELTKVLSISTERHRAEVRRAVNDERLTTIAYHMSGPNSSSEWSIEGRRLVPLMPRLVPQTAFTVTANAVASATANQNASLLLPAETGNKEVVVCYSYTSTTSTSATAPSGSAAAMVKSPRPASPASNMVVLPSGSTVYVKSVSCSDEDEKPRKRRRTNSSSSSPVVLKEVAKVTPPMSKTITVPVSGSPKMSNIMQSIANSLPPHMSPVKITFTKPTTQTTNTTTQKVIIVTTSPSSNFVPNILSKSHSHNYAAAMSKLVSTSMLTSANQKQTVLIPASSSPSSAPNTVAVTTMVSSSPSVVMSTIAQGGSSTGMKVASARLPSPKTMVGSPTQILAQFPKQHQQSPKQLQQGSPMGAGVMGQAQSSTTLPGSKPTIQIKQESGVKIITQQMQPSKILPKPSSVGMSSSSSSPIMVVSSNGAIMTTKLVSQPTGATYSRPTVSPSIGARMATSTSGATYVKTTSGSIITVVPKSLATLGGKIISSNIVSGTTTKITTIPMTSKPNVIVVQKATGKATTIQGLPGKNVVTTLLNAGGEKTLQGVPGSKPAIITASRPITKMIVTQPKGMGSGVQPNTTTKIIPTKIVYGQQGKTQVLIKPKPIFQTAVLSEQTRQLVSETLQQASRVADAQEGALKDESGGIAEGSFQPADDSQPVVHIISSRGQEWAEQHEVSVESGPTIIYQDVSTGNVTQSATSTIKALLELQQTTVKDKGEAKPRQHTIDLSQMAVPFQMAQDKKQQDPVSPGTSTVETEPRAGPSSGGDMVMSASQQLTASSQSTGHTPMVVKSIPTSSAVTVTRIVQLEMVMEEGELEGDTLDPQTGLFYRSIQLAAAPAPQHHTLPQPQSQSHSEPQSEQGRHMPHSTQPILKERPSSASGSPQLVGLGTPTKPPSLTPQLPKLQQAPTSHHRPIHTQLSQPPPLQAHHPVGADKTPSTSLPPIITQGASITKITFGGSSSHQSPPVSSSGEATAKLVPAEPSSSGPSGGEKPSVSDILKISMMEAEIDPSAEPMVVDSSSDCSPYGKGVGAGGDLGVLGGSGPVIPRYSIMPDSSQSNVVVEPSGFLEISNYTSQRLDEESVMEQEVDSSNDEATTVSPMEGCADQSQ
uniref:BRCA2-interacting transcriptional repressor EMSY n=1 Tax=Oncorhynchus tshawytscha TaxID=74940 RepID=A0A8C8G058_ONCTS